MANNDYPPYSQPAAPYQPPPSAEPPPYAPSGGNQGSQYAPYPPNTPYAQQYSQTSQYGPGYPVGNTVSGLAIASLICSVLGLGLVGVILGHLALGEIRRSNGYQEGRGLAIAGMVIGYVEIALGVLVFIFFIVVAVILHNAPLLPLCPSNPLDSPLPQRGGGGGVSRRS